MDSLKEIKSQAKKQINASDDLSHLEEVRVKYLGRKGEINQFIDSLSKKQLQTKGQAINQLKQEIQTLVKDRRRQLQEQKTQKEIDVTKPLPKDQRIPRGHLHLISEAIQEIEEIFSQLGFVRRRYPEIETDWYYAEGLNIPKGHPARDDQETFYFSDDLVLTAHTSSGQLREMENSQPPIKMINISKSYRRQASHTHSPMFHQFEGLMIDKNINMTHLIGVSNYFAQRYFKKNQHIRLRPHHFRFTEPSFEVDITCHFCQGKGQIDNEKCPVCKGGWLELGGAGMVHPKVLENGGLDPDKYTGFAFGWGVERIIMMKHQVSDNLRDLYSTDLRFLQQS